MSEAATLFADTCSRYPRKVIARWFGLPEDTVKTWRRRGFPNRRRRELADLVIKLADQQEKHLREIRARAIALLREGGE